MASKAGPYRARRRALTVALHACGTSPTFFRASARIGSRIRTPQRRSERASASVKEKRWEVVMAWARLRPLSAPHGRHLCVHLLTKVSPILFCFGRRRRPHAGHASSDTQKGDMHQWRWHWLATPHPWVFWGLPTGVRVSNLPACTLCPHAGLEPGESSLEDLTHTHTHTLQSTTFSLSLCTPTLEHQDPFYLLPACVDASDGRRRTDTASIATSCAWVSLAMASCTTALFGPQAAVVHASESEARRLGGSMRESAVHQ